MSRTHRLQRFFLRVVDTQNVPVFVHVIMSCASLLGAVRLPPNFTWGFVCVMVSMTPGGGGQFVDSSFFLSALICTDLRIAHYHTTMGRAGFSLVVGFCPFLAQHSHFRVFAGCTVEVVVAYKPSLHLCGFTFRMHQGQCVWLHCPHFLPLLPGTPRFSRRSNRTVMCVWLHCSHFPASWTVVVAKARTFACLSRSEGGWFARQHCSCISARDTLS